MHRVEIHSHFGLDVIVVFQATPSIENFDLDVIVVFWAAPSTEAEEERGATTEEKVREKVLALVQ